MWVKGSCLERLGVGRVGNVQDDVQRAGVKLILADHELDGGRVRQPQLLRQRGFQRREHVVVVRLQGVVRGACGGVTGLRSARGARRAFMMYCSCLPQTGYAIGQSQGSPRVATVLQLLATLCKAQRRRFWPYLQAQCITGHACPEHLCNISGLKPWTGNTACL